MAKAAGTTFKTKGIVDGQVDIILQQPHIRVQLSKYKNVGHFVISIKMLPETTKMYAFILKTESHAIFAVFWQNKDWCFIFSVDSML